MKRILIALDDSTTASKIAEIGYDFAKLMNGQMILLHVVSETPYYASPNYSPIIGFEDVNYAVETDAVWQIREVAQKYLDGFKQRFADERIETIIKSGDIGDAILKTAKELKVDIIVMGSHGRRGLEKILMGSVAEKVLKSSVTPLFIIPVKALN